ncbi:MAG: hypothetical protein IT431_15805 [Phycisphaerales bacterium]|nr:hypothetical protein [Phycisphaerales bacterium]
MSLDPLETPRVSDRDAALAHAIYDAAVRRWLTISYLAGLHLRQPWDGLEPGVLGALLGGAAQVLFFDRVPTHSAIDEAVEWAKQAVNPRAGGLVNAVLRRIAEMVVRDGAGEPEKRDCWKGGRDELPLADGTALVLRGEPLPQDDAKRIAVATGVPAWQVREWVEHHGDDDAWHLAWHSISGAPTIVHAPGAGAEELGAEAGLGAHASPTHRVFGGGRAELLELLGRHPTWWVQDPTASGAVDALGLPSARVVMDLCAGRGTKTRQLLVRYPEARVIACEVSAARLADLRQLARFAGERMSVWHVEDLGPDALGACDLVVADVPCSNSGVLARRVEARHRCAQRQITRLVEQQRQITGLAVQLLRPGGTLLYSTCSLEPAENAEQVLWAERALGLRLVTSRQRLPQGGPGEPASEYQDGGFAAVLVKPGG